MYFPWLLNIILTFLHYQSQLKQQFCSAPNGNNLLSEAPKCKNIFYNYARCRGKMNTQKI